MNDQTNNGHDDELETRLRQERPIPAAGFRARVRTALLQGARPAHARPLRVRALIAVYGGSGAVLLIVAAIGVGGAGPLAS